jgi:hypothetical protein
MRDGPKPVTLNVLDDEGAEARMASPAILNRNFHFGLPNPM